MDVNGFYARATVLITGGTGFFGKMLVQKLLRTHANIDKIYLVVRSKKGKSPEERMRDLYKNAVFDRLRDHLPNFTDKIVIVRGDCTRLGLALADADLRTLQDEVSVVFHCAANLNMNATLREAVNANVRGTKELLDICRGVKKLKSVAVVSTAYAMCVRPEIDEMLYRSSVDDALLVEMVNGIEDGLLEKMTPSLIGEYPNTYAYSKAVMENAILTKSSGLPVLVFRPTIVMPTAADPVPGWTDNIYGPYGLGLAITAGFCRVLNVKRLTRLENVPVDFCVDALICGACDATRRRLENPQVVPVYNYSSGEYTRTIGEYMDASLSQLEYPPKDIMWKPFCLAIGCAYCYCVLYFLLHTLPAQVVDGVLVVIGKKPRLVDAYKKFSRLSSVLTYFANREWTVKNDNVQGMWRRLSEAEKSLYQFDMSTLDWNKYYRDMLIGGKVYLLKEPLSETDKTKLRRLTLLHDSITFLVKALFVWILYNFTVFVIRRYDF